MNFPPPVIFRRQQNTQKDTLSYTNRAAEHGPCEDVSPNEKWGISIAMFVHQIRKLRPSTPPKSAHKCAGAKALSIS